MKHPFIFVLLTGLGPLLLGCQPKSSASDADIDRLEKRVADFEKGYQDQGPRGLPMGYFEWSAAALDEITSLLKASNGCRVRMRAFVLDDHVRVEPRAELLGIYLAVDQDREFCNIVLDRKDTLSLVALSRLASVDAPASLKFVEALLSGQEQWGKASGINYDNRYVALGCVAQMLGKDRLQSFPEGKDVWKLVYSDIRSEEEDVAYVAKVSKAFLSSAGWQNERKRMLNAGGGLGPP